MLKILVRFIFRLQLKTKVLIISKIGNLFSKLVLWSYNVNFGNNVKINGFPKFILKKDSRFIIGDDCRINSSKHFNPIGRYPNCVFRVYSGATLKFGKNVGISASTIISSDSITIGDNVLIGANCVFYDTDFHPISYTKRSGNEFQSTSTRKSPISIGDNVFIGAHSTILKGVIIGENSIIGAGSLVTKSIPSNQIWAGNPIKFIKEI